MEYGNTGMPHHLQGALCWVSYHCYRYIFLNDANLVLSEKQNSLNWIYDFFFLSFSYVKICVN